MKNFDGYKKCPYCGKLVIESAIFCKHCNKHLGNGENDSTTTKKNKISRNDYLKDRPEYKIGQICTIIVISALIYSFLGDVSYQISHFIPKVSAIKEPATLPGEAIQTNLKTPKQIEINSGKKYRLLLAQAEYSLTGIIVAKNTNFWLREIMQNDFDEVVPLDFGIAWGDIADKSFLKKYFKFSSQKTLGQARALKFSWKLPKNSVSSDYITSHISHNHIIPATDNVASALLRLNKWDTVKLDGYLVDIIQPSGYTSYTSLSRGDNNPQSRGASKDDGAGGACEIFYVTSVQIGKKHYE